MILQIGSSELKELAVWLKYLCSASTNLENVVFEHFSAIWEICYIIYFEIFSNIGWEECNLDQFFWVGFFSGFFRFLRKMKMWKEMLTIVMMQLSYFSIRNAEFIFLYECKYLHFIKLWYIIKDFHTEICISPMNVVGPIIILRIGMRVYTKQQWCYL